MINHYVTGPVRGAFSHDVTAAILVFQDNETAAMLVFQSSPLGVGFFSYANEFFCKLAGMLVTLVKTLYMQRLEAEATSGMVQT